MAALVELRHGVLTAWKLTLTQQALQGTLTCVSAWTLSAKEARGVSRTLRSIIEREGDLLRRRDGFL